MAEPTAETPTPAGPFDGAAASPWRLALVADDAAWDSFVEATRGGHHVQTSGWAGVKSMDGWDVSRVVARDAGDAIVGGAQMLHKPLVAGRRIGYVPKGPLLAVDDPDLMELLVSGIYELAKQLGVAHLTVQPPNQGPAAGPHLVAAGFSTTDSAVAPTATIFVDLTADPDAMLARMKKNHRRYIRYGLASGHGGSARGSTRSPSFSSAARSDRSPSGLHPVLTGPFRRHVGHPVPSRSDRTVRRRI